jgi:hypothetical protein
MEQNVFEKWLRKQGYQDSTVKLTLRHLQSAFSLWKEDDRKALPNGHLVIPMRRYLGFVSSTRKHTFPRGFGKAIGLRYDPMVAKPNGSRKKPDLTMGQWRRLFDKLDASKLEDDLMLKLYMLQPYRLGDFLSMDMVELADTVGARNVPLRLRRGKNSTTVADLMCPESTKPATCAKSRLRRRLCAWAEDMGWDCDMNTLHRVSLRVYNAS